MPGPSWTSGGARKSAGRSALARGGRRSSEGGSPRPEARFGHGYCEHQRAAGRSDGCREHQWGAERSDGCHEHQQAAERSDGCRAQGQGAHSGRVRDLRRAAGHSGRARGGSLVQEECWGGDYRAR